ncbi:ATP-dependent zinc metalloprotease FtsH [bacterium]|nr:ATP-dependent zinc metalloprotease FtsH [bacterium]
MKWSNWILPVGLLVLAVLLIQATLMEPRPIQVTYSEFRKLLDAGSVQSVVTGQGVFTGNLKESIADTSGRRSRQFSVDVNGLPRDTDLVRLCLEKNVDIKGSPDPNPFSVMLVWLLPTAIVVALLYFLVFRRMGPGGGAMMFGRSKAKLYAHEDLNVSFDDVAGLEEAVDELREVVDFLKNPEKYQAVGGRIPKGVMLVGPPGTGKTLLARAVAGEAGVPFFGLSGSDFVEMFVGVGAARVRDLFAQAEQRAPCIIFIDELDAIGKSRGSGFVGGHDEREQTLNQLLVEMDGFDSNRGVIIMAATNRPEILDAALLRPGRFDRTVVVDRPDVNGREAILQVHARNVKVAEDLNLREIASLTPGFVGADLANLINEAALLAGRKGFPHVTRHLLEEAIERSMAGLERKQRVMMPEEKRRIAYHECGHAIVAFLLPGSDPVHKISIVPRGIGALGYTLQRPLDDRYLATQSELESRICTLLGGITAEEIVFSETSTGAQNDLQRVASIARSMVKDFGMSPELGRLQYRDSQDSAFLGTSLGATREYSETTAREIDMEVRRIVDQAQVLVRNILNQHRPSLEKLAERLLEKEVLDATEFKEVMEASSPRLVPGTSPIRTIDPKTNDVDTGPTRVDGAPPIPGAG